MLKQLLATNTRPRVVHDRIERAGPRSSAAALAPPAYGIDFVDSKRGTGAIARDGVNVPIAELEDGRAAAPVQRAVDWATPAPSSSSSAELPRAVRAKMERAFGADFSAVRIHDGSQARAIGALAYTQGTDIHFAAGQYRPHELDGQEILGHELTHVLQQAQGRVHATKQARGVAINDDPALEREADEMGRRAARVAMSDTPRPVQRAQVEVVPTRASTAPVATAHAAMGLQDASSPVAGTTPTARAGTGVVQGLLEYEGTTGVTTYATAGQAFNDMVSSMSDGTLRAEVFKKKDQVLAVLKEWVESSTSSLVRAVYWQYAHHRKYRDYNEMARAALGTAEALENRKQEAELAQQTKKSDYIDKGLNGLVTKIRAKVDSDLDAKGKKEILNNWHMGQYWPWYYTLLGGLDRVLSNPASHSMAAKVAAIHDVMDYFSKKQQHAHKDATHVPNDKQQGTVLFDPGDGSRVPRKAPLGAASNFRHPEGTLKETNPVIYAARLKKMLLWAGPSYTTGRMMQISEWAGASTEEKQALAWALFAFWNQDYYQSQTMIHTFHEVMDMASNYGVPYTPLQYRDAPPKAPEAMV